MYQEFRILEPATGNGTNCSLIHKHRQIISCEVESCFLVRVYCWSAGSGGRQFHKVDNDKVDHDNGSEEIGLGKITQPYVFFGYTQSDTAEIYSKITNKTLFFDTYYNTTEHGNMDLYFLEIQLPYRSARFLIETIQSGNYRKAFRTSLPDSLCLPCAEDAICGEVNPFVFECSQTFYVTLYVPFESIENISVTNINVALQRLLISDGSLALVNNSVYFGILFDSEGRGLNADDFISIGKVIIPLTKRNAQRLINAVKLGDFYIDNIEFSLCTPCWMNETCVEAFPFIFQCVKEPGEQNQGTGGASTEAKKAKLSVGEIFAIVGIVIGASFIIVCVIFGYKILKAKSDSKFFYFTQ